MTGSATTNPLLALVLVIAAAIAAIISRRNKRHQSRLHQIEKIVRSHQSELISQRKALTETGSGGRVDDSKWRKQIQHFTRTVVAPQCQSFDARYGELTYNAVQNLTSSFAENAGAPVPPMQPSFVKTYHGSQAEALAAFQRDASVMASRAYFPTSQSWAAGEWGVGAFLVAVILCFVVVGFFALIYMLVVKPMGALSVTYTWRAPSVEKTCPRCAENVKHAATVCRFCGHAFP